MTESTILDLAGACVAAVQNAIGVELDFTPDTLPLLDHYAREAELPGDEVLELVAPMCGAYFGEVVRRALGSARWHCPEGAPERWRLEFEDCFLYFNPVGVAVEALLEEEAPGWHAHLSTLPGERKVLEDALGVFGEVRADDYFRFSIRFEAIEQVHQTLGRRAAEQGDARRRFGPEVYRVAADAEAVVEPKGELN